MIQKGTNKPFNQYHLNALYGVLNERYWDIDLHTAAKTKECDAFIHILHEGRYPENAIALFDRGFESYNLFAHRIEKKQKFAVRVKDMTINGMLSSINLPEGEWDQDITIILTRKQTNEVKNQPDKYKYIAYTTIFDFLDYRNEYYEITLRIVRFKIAEGVYECLVTNLSRDEMTFESMKELYHLRWNEETSFRALKYNIGLVHFSFKEKSIYPAGDLCEADHVQSIQGNR